MQFKNAEAAWTQAVSAENKGGKRMEMKKCRRTFSLLLALMLLALTACGKTGPDQGSGEEPSGEDPGRTEEERQEGESSEGSGNGISLKMENLFLHYQPIERTWEKDYTGDEWKDGKRLNIYVMIPDMERQEIPVIEEELNHRLYMAGYDFYIHFQGPTYDEMFGENWEEEGGQTSDELVRRKRDGGEPIDIWISEEYVSAVQNGEVLELTDFLESEEGSGLYADFDQCVWEQVRDEEGRIYGIPVNPIAALRCVYAYNPQLLEQLSIDEASFPGGLGDLEELFPALLQRDVLPVRLAWIEDTLMLSMVGLENYGGILAVRHKGEEWEAVDLWEEEEVLAFYTQLGRWREEGYLGYADYLSEQLRTIYDLDIGSGNDGSQYSYTLFDLAEVDTNSYFWCVNPVGNEGRAMSRFYVPNRPVYISKQGNLDYGVAVVGAGTEYPRECKEFLKLLYLDPEIRLLLYKGIEGEHYIWKDEVLINGSAYGFPIGLGFTWDMRFWPVGDWGAGYVKEIENMNRNVSMGLGATMPYDLSETTELSDKEAACRRIIEENRPVFLGCYGDQTAERLEEVHGQLVEAGYLELIEAVNAKHK